MNRVWALDSTRHLSDEVQGCRKVRGSLLHDILEKDDHCSAAIVMLQTLLHWQINPVLRRCNDLVTGLDWWPEASVHESTPTSELTSLSPSLLLSG